MKKEEQTKPRRYPLLVYDVPWQDVQWPAILALLATLAVFVWNPEQLQVIRPLWLLLALVIVFLVYLRWRATKVTYVEVREEDILIHGKSLALRVPLEWIQLCRPTIIHEHIPTELLQTREMEPVSHFAGNSAIVMELREWPWPKERIAKVFGPYMLAQDTDGLLLLVEDWLSLHRQIDDAQDRWRHRHLPPPTERFKREIHKNSLED
jgi:hypothetical protein